jgi:hypothetical protein
MYMSSYQQLYAIVTTIKGDPALVQSIRLDLPSTYWETSEQLFPGRFWSGKFQRFSPSGLDFKKVFVDNKTNFDHAVRQLKELLKLVNTTSDQLAVTAMIKELAGSRELPGLNVFRLQLFIPLAALCGLIPLISCITQITSNRQRELTTEVLLL